MAQYGLKWQKTFSWAVVLAVACGLQSGAQAQTLEKISKSKVLNIGVREDNLPFAGYSQGVASGYSIDLCQKVAEQIRKELKLSELRVQYVVVTAADRLAKVRDGVADIECGTTVNTQTRAKDVEFSYAHFIAGTRFMSKQSAGLSDYTQLNNQAVGIVKGTTAEKLFNQLRDDTLKSMKLVVFSKNQDAMKALEAGSVAAVAQLDILLEGMRQSSAQPAQYAISTKSLSIEPMTLMVRKEDPAFKAVVDKTLANLYASGEISSIYERWFKTSKLNTPVSLMLADCFRRPCNSRATALGLGYML
ncbi:MULTISPECIES: amino acid ABC transporter substrate-binding protein [unclassified Uliginosibacterium]|uniref:amino acid ABC transporter substrate-binding protein n=1 Tax=unclassified Uliginosibacterium TaxID=2621521 RepID=UPI000C7A48DA|nr:MULTISPECIES: amino acid ABC transporter substrate-binding protein [unclassified Uliginosibacterium]MDO6388343.1 amino acid ABC transporter substrate-binding protein [Uliginosibacterium sp. 31-12]PLK47252.1 amino acid ABC transporter substrate-binding protein [Uliginosibacterium sp. TH139]